MVKWITRAQSGLVAPRPMTPRTDQLIGVTVHHTASAQPPVPLDSLALWRQLQADAMSGNNVNHTQYSDIEYNAAFDDFGQILVGRQNDVVGAHATSSNNIANRVTLGFAYLGNSDIHTPSSQAIAALHAYLYVVALELGHAPFVLGHKDLVGIGGIPTACPGHAVEVLIRP
jgi:hypothetical protein